MKNLTLLTLLSMLLFLSSCKKDDEGPSNTFTFDGNTITLANGYITNYGNNGNDSYDFDVLLTSETIIYDQTTEEFTGNGDILYLDLNSSLSTGLEVGNYIYNEEREAFTLVDAEAILNANLEQESGTEITLVGGSVEVSFDGDETILKFDLTSEENKNLKGEFKGILKKL